MSLEFEARFMVLIPVLASLTFGVFCAFLLLSSPFEVYPVTPFDEGVGSVANALYFVILIGAGATLVYLLIKSKRQKVINLVIEFALTLAFFAFSFVYLSAFFAKFTIYNAEAWVWPLSSLITLLADFAVFGKNNAAYSLVILGLGGALGAFLGASIPTLSAVLILIFLAVYDVFAVYRGPVGKIAQSGLDQLKGLSLSFRNIQMGLGDLTFYSMLSAHMLLNFGFTSCGASVVGISIGCLLAFDIVEKKGIFPGLPFPLLLGLAAGFATSLMSL